MHPLAFALVTAVLALGAGVAAAAELRAASGAGRNVLVELYTSEGCNSCPPAEAFLNNLQADPGLWTRYVPLAFHVDYWDYLGWRDRYAAPAHAARQRRYASLGGVRTVYTPAFIVNGRGWGVFGARAVLPDGGAPAGRLELRAGDGTFDASFLPAPQINGPFELHLALLGMGLSTEIRAGENKGRRARHEFVVLAHAVHAPAADRWTGKLPLAADTHGAHRFALAAWVSRPGDPSPLQATGGYLP